MSERELPPIRVRIIGDDTDFRQTLKSVQDAISSAAKSAAVSGGGGAGSAGGGGGKGGGGDDFERIFHNYRLLEKSKQVLFDLEIQNIELIQKARDIAFDKEFDNLLLLNKAKSLAESKEFSAMQIAQKMADLEFDRQFSNELLLEKQKALAAKQEKVAFDREFSNEVLLEKQREIAAKREQDEFDRTVRNEVLLQKSKDTADEKEFSNFALLEKARKAASEQEFMSLVLSEKIKENNFDREIENTLLLQKSKDIAFDKEFSNLVLLSKARSIAEDEELSALQIAQKLQDLEFEREFENLRILEKQKQADADKAEQRRRAELKYNSLLLEDKQKREAAAAKKRAEEEEQDRKDRFKGTQMYLSYEEVKQKAADLAAKKATKKAEQAAKDQWKGVQMYLSYEEVKQKAADLAAKKAAKKAEQAGRAQWRGVQMYLSYEGIKQRMAERSAAAAERERIARDKRVFNNYVSLVRREMREAAAAEREKVKAAKQAEREKIKAAKDAERERKRLAMGGSGLGGGLSARADIYMHLNALRSISQSGKGMLDVYSNIKKAESGIEVFAGSADKAKAIIQDLMEQSQVTPYGMETLVDQARTFMARGLDADTAIQSLKNLGSVAGGDVVRLERLGLAMSQVSTLGKLMQEELNQLAEQGFNPLVVMAQQTTKTTAEYKARLAELYEAKKQGLITDKHVFDALAVATQKGSKYNEQLKKMSNEVGGLTNRLKNMIMGLKVDAITALDEKLKAALKTSVYYVQVARDWIKEDKARAARIMEIVSKVGALVVSFHLMGLAISSVRWWLSSVFSLAAGLRVIFMPIVQGLNMLGSVGVFALGRLYQSFALVRYAAIAYFDTMSFLSQAMSRVAASIALATGWLYANTTAYLRAAWAALMNSSAVAFLVREYNIMRGMGILSYIYYTASAMWASFTATIANSSAVRYLAAQFALLRSMGLVGYLWSVAASILSLGAYMFSAAGATLAWGFAVGSATSIMSILNAAMLAFQVYSTLAWIAFLGPIALAVGAIGLLIAGIWAAAGAIGGEGGLPGAFARAFEYVKWFFGAAYGFFYNFGENAQIVGKYLYDNWRTLFSDLLKIVVGFVSAIPNNILIMWRTGVRLTVAFGTWLISYLPTAIKNAFSSAMGFVKDVFFKIMDAGKRVWKFITTPSEWASGAAAVTGFLSTLAEDVQKTKEDGFYERAKTIIQEESSKLKTGLEGVDLQSPVIDLNLKVPASEDMKPPEPPPAPEAPTLPEGYGDFGSIMPGEKQTKKSDRYQVQDAISAHSGDYTKKMSEYMDRVRGMKASPSSDPKLAAAQKTNQLLQRIEKNTSAASVQVETADL